MGRILLDDTEIEVSEDVEEILNRVVKSRDGVRHGSGRIVAPPGWVTLSAPDTGEIYVQVARIGYVHE
jgi:hypothetical protein